MFEIIIWKGDTKVAIFYVNRSLKHFAATTLSLRVPTRRCVPVLINFPPSPPEYSVVFSPKLKAQTFLRPWKLWVCMQASVLWCTTHSTDYKANFPNRLLYVCWTIHALSLFIDINIKVWLVKHLLFFLLLRVHRSLIEHDVEIDVQLPIQFKVWFLVDIFSERRQRKKQKGGNSSSFCHQELF